MNVYSTSLQGTRPSNEDAHVIITNINGKDKNMQNVNFLGVYDGHGNSRVSSFLRDNLSKFFMDKRITYPISKKYVMSVHDYLQSCLSKTDYAKNAGSTALYVIHFFHNGEEYLNVINLGDCRSVLCRDNFAIVLSKDAKPNYPEEFYRITALGGEVKCDNNGDWRVKDLSVSRAFGDLDATPFVTHRPDLFRYKLDKTDKFIVLACDGLYDVMQNHEIVNFILLNCYDSTLNNRINKHINIAKKLAEYAIKRGSQDNVSIIILFLNHEHPTI
jgi:serine/threonine protein phosphatase PrpC